MKIYKTFNGIVETMAASNLLIISFFLLSKAMAYFDFNELNEIAYDIAIDDSPFGFDKFKVQSYLNNEFSTFKFVVPEIKVISFIKTFVFFLFSILWQLHIWRCFHNTCMRSFNW